MIGVGELAALDEGEGRGVLVFAVPGEEVHVEIADGRAARGVGHLVELGRPVPRARRWPPPGT